MSRCKQLLYFGGFSSLLLLGVTQTLSAASTQFDFNGPGFAPTFGPGSLAFYSTTTAADVHYGSASSFGLPAMPGGDAGVMQFPAFRPDQGLFLQTGALPNGGGSYINQYTMIWDLLIPNISANWFSFFNSNDANQNDGDFFIRPDDGGIGISGEYHGGVSSMQWHRIAVSFDLTTASMSKYIDGVLVGSQVLSSGLDGRWSLYSANDTANGVLLLTDNDGDVNNGYINSFYFTDRVLSSQEIADLGGPNALGIVVPEPAAASLILACAAVGFLSRRRR